MSLLSRLGIQFPIIQAPMAGVSTPSLAAAVSTAGGLGSISVGATNADGARAMIQAVRALTDRPFNVNLFVHEAPRINPAKEAEWLSLLSPLFAALETQAPSSLNTIYQSFKDDDDMLEMLLETRPPIVSFHFGLPGGDKVEALKSAGCILLCTATSVAEAEAAQMAGVDAIIAQGFEAGGHRGVFDPNARDDELGTIALTRHLCHRLKLPIIAAGGIMDGRGIAAARALGAEAAQLGTAFIACPESSADSAYRNALMGDGANHTRMTSVISGRPARCLANMFTTWEDTLETTSPPDYPRAYDAGKALNQMAKLKDEFGYGAQWAGQGAPLARALPAAELVELLAQELAQAER